MAEFLTSVMGQEVEPYDDWETDYYWFADFATPAFSWDGAEGLNEQEFESLIYSLTMELEEYTDQESMESMCKSAFDYYADTDEGVSVEKMYQVWDELKWGYGWFGQFEEAGMLPEPVDGPADGSLWNDMKMHGGMDMNGDGHVDPEEAAAWVT